MLKQPYRQHSLVFLLFAVLTVWYSFPLVLHLDNGFVSELKGADAVQYVWNAWISGQNLAEHKPFFFTDRVLAPEGANLVMHTYTPALSLFSLLFSNPYLGLNLFLLLNFLLSAFGAYYLAYDLLRDRAGAILTGLVFGFSAYKLLHFPQHYHLLLTAPVPFFILGFLKGFSFSENRLMPRITHRAWAFSLLPLGGISALSDYYTTFYLIYFVVLYTLFQAYHPRWQALGRRQKWLGISVLFIGAHLLVQTLRNHGIDDKGGIWWGGDLLSFFMPNPDSGLWNADWFSAIMPRVKRSPGNLELDMFQGYGMIALGLFVGWQAVRGRLRAEIKVWAFILLVFTMICLPALVVNGAKILYLPTGILHFVPFFNNIRCPTRIQSMIALVLPLCGAWTLLTSAEIPYRKAILWAVPALTIFELKPETYPLLTTEQVPEIIYTLRDGNAHTLLPMPFGVRDGMRKIGEIELNDLYFQTIHGKNLLGGYISRIPPSTFERYLADPVCSALLTLSAEPNKKSTDPTQAQIDTFFQTFSPDAILIDPAFRGTRAEQYIDLLLRDRRIENTEKGGYRLILIAPAQ